MGLSVNWEPSTWQVMQACCLPRSCAACWIYSTDAKHRQSVVLEPMLVAGRTVPELTAPVERVFTCLPLLGGYSSAAGTDALADVG